MCDFISSKKMSLSPYFSTELSVVLCVEHSAAISHSFDYFIRALHEIKSDSAVAVG